MLVLVTHTEGCANELLKLRHAQIRPNPNRLIDVVNNERIDLEIAEERRTPGRFV
jgi:hypothetical protein